MGWARRMLLGNKGITTIKPVIAARVSHSAGSFDHYLSLSGYPLVYFVKLVTIPE